MKASARLRYMKGSAQKVRLVADLVRGRKVNDDSFALLFNAHFEDIEFTVPPQQFGAKWEMLIDTTEPLGYPEEKTVVAAGDTVVVPARATLVLKQVESPVR